MSISQRRGTITALLHRKRIQIYLAWQIGDRLTLLNLNYKIASKVHVIAKRLEGY